MLRRAALCGDVARQTLGGTVGATVGSLLTVTGSLKLVPSTGKVQARVKLFICN